MKRIPIIRWNNKDCVEPDMCLRLDDQENAMIFWYAVSKNEVNDGQVNEGLFIKTESVTEKEWKEIERRGNEMA